MLSIKNWLFVNKLSLNIEKSNFVVFRPSQRKIAFPLRLILNNRNLNQVSYIKYLAVIIDECLNWKQQVNHIGSKVKRGIGILSKLRHFVPTNILVNLYYTMIYPYLTYGVVAWGNTYDTTVKPIGILQKRAIRIMTFADFRDHSNPLFIRLYIMKFNDIVRFQTAIFMHEFHHGNLPCIFNSIFHLVNSDHNYSTRLASNKSNYSLPFARTNYGKFNIRFFGIKFWNSLNENLRSFKKAKFKKTLFSQILNSYHGSP